MTQNIQVCLDRSKVELEETVRAVVARLQDILKHERKHFNYYLQACMVVTGPDRIYLKPLFEKEMMGELQHVRAFGDKILALGGYPGTRGHDICWGDALTGQEILVGAVEMEREVLQHYHSLYPLAEDYAAKFGDKSVVLLLEENIEHTTADVEEMEKLLVRAKS